MVQVMGFEPTGYRYHQNLNLARLPIPPHLHILFLALHILTFIKIRVKRFGIFHFIREKINSKL